MTLTSAIGKFTFSVNTKLSYAKLIRDAVVGQILNPTDGRKLRDAESVRTFVDIEFKNTPARLEGFSLFI